MRALRADGPPACAPVPACGAASARPPPRALRDIWVAWRSRLLASARFQRWALRLPFTRGIARRRVQGLFDLCAGFVYTQVLLACVRLRVIEQLAAGPQDTLALAAGSGLDPAATERLLRAAASLSMVQVIGPGRWSLGPHGAVLQGDPALRLMIEHHALLYADLADPVALLRGTAPRPTCLESFWSYARSSDPAQLPPQRVAGYSELMHASQALVARTVLDAYPFRRHRSVLDAGGGSGAFLAALARRAPRLTLTLYDLPPVAQVARARLAAEGLAARVRIACGDFLREEWPRGADLVCLVRVLHDHDDPSVRRILAAARAALLPGGTLLIAEPLAAARSPVADAYFGMYLLAMGSGRARSAGELQALLREAGFGRAREYRSALPALVRVLAASSA